MKKVITKSGVVAELNGRFWGIQYEDGHSTSCGFGKISKAMIGDPKYCKGPEDMTFKGSHYVKELRKAKLRTIKRTTTYEVQGV